LTFWIVSHLAYNPALLEQIREEVLPAVQGYQVDEAYLLEQCPKLDSLVSETLRLTVTSSLARVIVEPTVVGGKMLKPGNKIMVRFYMVYILFVTDLPTHYSCRSANCIITLRYGARIQEVSIRVDS
jgi:cholesterol 7alpha-monooxygenase